MMGQLASLEPFSMLHEFKPMYFLVTFLILGCIFMYSISVHHVPVAIIFACLTAAFMICSTLAESTTRIVTAIEKSKNP
jgi:hypothetical protein